MMPQRSAPGRRRPHRDPPDDAGHQHAVVERQLARDVEQATRLDRGHIGGDRRGRLRQDQPEFGEARVDAHHASFGARAGEVKGSAGRARAICEAGQDPVARLVPVVDPRVGVGRGRDGAGERRFGDHVQPPDRRRVLGDRFVMRPQIVDEHRRGRLELFEQGGDRRALAALVADHAVVDAVRGQLRDAAGMPLFEDVGEHHDVGDLADRRERLGGVGDERLAVHLVAEEMVQQRPQLLVGNSDPSDWRRVAA
jgi:hypothetical protein